jgi:hypothetical protein
MVYHVTYQLLGERGDLHTSVWLPVEHTANEAASEVCARHAHGVDAFPVDFAPSAVTIIDEKPV